MTLYSCRKLGSVVGDIWVVLWCLLDCFSNFVSRACDGFIFGTLLLTDKRLFNLDIDIPVQYVSLYFPPDNSSFYSDNVMSGLKQLEDDIIRNNLLVNKLLINGDFNTRTGNLSDFMKGTHNIQELEEFNDIVEGDICLDRVTKHRR